MKGYTKYLGVGVISNNRLGINVSKIILRSENNNNLCFTDYFNLQKYTVLTEQVTWGLGRWNDLYGGIMLYETVQSGRWVPKFRIDSI
jgi:hypothetical protein